MVCARHRTPCRGRPGLGVSDELAGIGDEDGRRLGDGAGLWDPAAPRMQVCEVRFLQAELRGCPGGGASRRCAAQGRRCAADDARVGSSLRLQGCGDALILAKTRGAGASEFSRGERGLGCWPSTP